MFRGGVFRLDKKPLISGEFQITAPIRSAPYSIYFLIDTGSDDVIISFSDALRLKIYDIPLPVPTTISGLSGGLPVHAVSANVSFLEAGRVVGYRRTIYVAAVGSMDMKVPSIVGQDIISSWDLRINHSRSILEIIPVSCDFSIP